MRRLARWRRSCASVSAYVVCSSRDRDGVRASDRPIRGGRVLAVAGVPGDPTTYYFVLLLEEFSKHQRRRVVD